MMNVYKVFAYKTMYEVFAKKPKVLLTPPLGSAKEAEAFAKQEMPDSFLVQVQLFQRA
ncbi:hypothetical protein C7445_105170 [Alicyclobacillus sacchari]|uniref:Uncharacterized protein n=1 Tax=Alicyclobacillus sacchari TaxID=392010 RepID=A0A4V3HEJ0_9BACL|nr:hypothetical protein [Alicyclobacillus sacchari]TDY47989.1 hypothetical protein C7445_105170 [Alicyclobacillus sacchari]GMA56114.1 hypothetical protein GCM10025858_06170 [Alicyclobacillus sacchari]